MDGGSILWIETRSSNEEIAATIEMTKIIDPSICRVMTFDTASRSMMGVVPAEFTSFALVRGADFICAKFSIPA